MQKSHPDAGRSITTPREAMRILESGGRLLCEFIGPLSLQASDVVRVEGTRVLVRHWKDQWFDFGCGIQLVAVPELRLEKPGFNQWLKSRGIEWPNLGVNFPAGASWAAANMMAELIRQYRSFTGRTIGGIMASVDDVLRDLGERGMMKEIEKSLEKPHLDEIHREWIRAGNITWFEAFAIWLLRARGFESLP